ncbi:ABC transporter permease [Kroppenstedtia eburnea]|uniref:ABC transporter permease n=1 Tax=Kroppenstedtia eburnea TaxID=714067 RepID=UPI00363DA5B4
MLRILAAERLKMKRTWLPVLVLLGPAGILLSMLVDFGLRRDYLLQQPLDSWVILVKEVSALLPLAMLLGSTLLASLMVGVEHQASAWKHLMTLPLSRFRIYLGKGIQMTGWLLLAGILMVPAFALLWTWFELGKEVPWASFLKGGLYPVLAVLPVAMLQLWLSVVIRNQALPVFIGVVGSLFNRMLPAWMPWAYPGNSIPARIAREGNNPEVWVPVGIGVGILLLILGGLHFSRREVEAG